MQDWFKKHFVTADQAVARIVRWVTFIGLLAALMSGLVSSIPIIAQYGWGAVALVGLAVASLLILAATASLALWRYFRPIRDTKRLPSNESSIVRFTFSGGGFGQSAFRCRYEDVNVGPHTTEKRRVIYEELWVRIKAQRFIRNAQVRIGTLDPEGREHHAYEPAGRISGDINQDTFDEYLISQRVIVGGTECILFPASPSPVDLKGAGAHPTISVQVLHADGPPCRAVFKIFFRQWPQPLSEIDDCEIEEENLISRATGQFFVGRQ